MNRRRRILLALGGLGAALLVGVPLAQRLSVELMQLQIREQYLDERLTLPVVARDFDIPEPELVRRLGLQGITRAELDRLSLAELAARRGMTTKAFKARVVSAVFSEQFKDLPGFGAWGLRSASDRPADKH